MSQGPFAWWPVAASLRSVEVDHLVIAFTALLVVLVTPIFALLPYWLWKYRRGRPADRTHRVDRNIKLELSWMLIPFVASLGFFVWAAFIYDDEFHPPPDAQVVQAVGRQWMWKFQHNNGQWEINDLHVPVGEAIRIDLTSQDVIHALYIPAMRVQMDAIPGRTTELWFKADRVGSYELYCSELCGVDHSLMRGRLYVMTAANYAAWLRHAGIRDTLPQPPIRLPAGSRQTASMERTR